MGLVMLRRHLKGERLPSRTCNNKMPPPLPELCCMMLTSSHVPYPNKLAINLHAPQVPLL